MVGSTSVLPRQRRHTSRSRRGCLTCRHRRKKCPDDGPECQSCIRLNLECIWDTRRRVVSRPGVVTRSPPPSASTTVTVTGEGDDSGNSPSCNSSSMSPSVLLRTVTPSPFPSRIDTSEQKMLLSYYLHSFVPNISVSYTPTNLFINAYVPMAFECDAILQAILACSATHLAKTAFTSADRARFLAVSLQHQRQCHHFLRQRIGHTVQGGPTLQRDPLEATAIILLLVGLEVQSGAHTSKWVSQVDCVRRIIRDAGGKTAFCRSSWEAKAIYGHFLYHDVMSLLMDGVVGRDGTDYAEAVAEAAGDSPAPPLQEAEAEAGAPWARYLPPEGRPSPFVDPVHPLLGLSKSLFVMMQKIRHVKPIVQQKEGGRRIFNPTDNHLFLELEKDISNIRFEIYPSLGETSTSSNSSSSLRMDTTTRLDLVILAETYRFAALILLYRRSCMHKEQIPALARHIVTMAGRITQGNAAEAGLTYPLFLAGAELQEEDDIMSCATRLKKIRERVKVMNIQAVEEVLQEVWRERLNGGEYRDWETVLRNWDWVINLG